MRVVTAIEPWSPPERPCTFLAGGITGCPDWQYAALAMMIDRDYPGTVFNPRRPDFPIDDPEAAPEQIAWEYERIMAANLVLFWFPEETLCPITLYELGKCSALDKHLAVGTHPGYKRRLDVVEQTSLSRPDVVVRDSLEDVLADAKRGLGESAI